MAVQKHRNMLATETMWQRYRQRQRQAGRETETDWQREEQIYSDGEPIRLKDKNRLVERDTEKETGWRRHRQI
jgi:hypothetical protein